MFKMNIHFCSRTLFFFLYNSINYLTAPWIYLSALITLFFGAAVAKKVERSSTDRRIDGFIPDPCSQRVEV